MSAAVVCHATPQSVAAHWKKNWWRPGPVGSEGVWEPKPGAWPADSPEPVETYAALLALPADASADQIRRVLRADRATSTWVDFHCHGCDEWVEIAVRVGQEPDYESSTAHLCAACLAGAAAALESFQARDPGGDAALLRAQVHEAWKLVGVYAARAVAAERLAAVTPEGASLLLDALPKCVMRCGAPGTLAFDASIGKEWKRAEGWWRGGGLLCDSCRDAEGDVAPSIRNYVDVPHAQLVRDLLSRARTT